MQCAVGNVNAERDPNGHKPTACAGAGEASVCADPATTVQGGRNGVVERNASGEQRGPCVKRNRNQAESGDP